jgi:hypothetical protein
MTLAVIGGLTLVVGIVLALSARARGRAMTLLNPLLDRLEETSLGKLALVVLVCGAWIALPLLGLVWLVLVGYVAQVAVTSFVAPVVQRVWNGPPTAASARDRATPRADCLAATRSGAMGQCRLLSAGIPHRHSGAPMAAAATVLATPPVPPGAGLKDLDRNRPVG